MADRTYYDLLEIPPIATSDDIKRAFRNQIARYHPDKVQHLGKEFQEIAAVRAAELTEAYRILSREDSRAEYDRALAAGSAVPAAVQTPPSSQPGAAPPPTVEEPAAERPAGPAGDRTAAFGAERASRDRFVRQAALVRLREALGAVAKNTYDEAQVGGFDLAYAPKSRMFARQTAPRLLGKFVATVDAEAVSDAWMQAAKWGAAGGDELCVLLIGSSLAPVRDLATAIAEQRRKTRSAKLTLIPVDARDWEAHMPTDAPAVARNLIGWLRQQAGLGNKWS